ncbi:hypothetical protein pdam_00010943, partial [Pocillopora damicornis]
RVFGTSAHQTILNLPKASKHCNRENTSFWRKQNMSYLQSAGIWMASTLFLSPDESPSQRRACIAVGRELRKIADDLEASARREKVNNEQAIVVDAIKAVCAVAGVFVVGRLMTLRIHLLALRMIDSHSARKYFYFTQYDTRFETGTLSTELCLVLYLMAHVSSPYC